MHTAHSRVRSHRNTLSVTQCNLDVCACFRDLLPLSVMSVGGSRTKLVENFRIIAIFDGQIENDGRRVAISA